MTTVMVVEDDPALLTRFCKIVASDAELELFAAVADVASARQAMSKATPDVLLTDLGLPDGSGIDLIRETARRYPDTDIMVITVFGDEDHVLASIEAGATGYILKDSLPQEFVHLIKQLRAGGSPISPVIARQLLRRLKPAADPTEPGHDALQHIHMIRDAMPAGKPPSGLHVLLAYVGPSQNPHRTVTPRRAGATCATLSR